MASNLNYKSLTDDFTIDTGYSMFVCDCSSKSFKITLPDPTNFDATNYRVLRIDSTTGKTLTLARNGSEKIDGTAADLVIMPNVSLEIEVVSGNWRTAHATYPSHSKVHCAANAPQSISSNIVQSYTSLLDTHSAFNASTGTYTVPANQAGTYRVEAQVTFKSSLVSAFITPVIAINVNGTPVSTITSSLSLGLVNAVTNSFPVAWIGSLAASDAVTVTATSITNLSILTATATASYFALQRIA